MPRIGLYFLGLASLCLLGGVSLGMYMGMAHDFQLAPVHAHLNLLGWASLALFGLSYCAVPQLAEGWLPKLHLLLSGVSAPLFPIGIYFAMLKDNASLTMVTAPMWFLGALTFSIIVWRAALRRAPSPEERPALA
ncbi:hypothetical protein ACFSCW_04445 [Sphingomonas tabacisoli]|uniref:Cytochrome-c oxidase n=1 Tax=Sphingomonas tabacisoli TaxID=2249466 RepID=A0ABW4I0R1_9SPHN